MNPKITLIMFLLFAGIGVLKPQAQSLVIKTKTGTEQLKQLSTLKRITFSNNNLQVNYLSGTAETVNLSTISKLYFKTGITGIENTELPTDSWILSIYPNPVNNVIYIKSVPEGVTPVSIYRMDGTMVLQFQVSEENKCIQTGNLNKGLYLLRMNNQAIKFIKQ